MPAVLSSTHVHVGNKCDQLCGSLFYQMETTSPGNEENKSDGTRTFDFLPYFVLSISKIGRTTQSTVFFLIKKSTSANFE
jgi:hypothetical protein